MASLSGLESSISVKQLEKPRSPMVTLTWSKAMRDPDLASEILNFFQSQCLSVRWTNPAFQVYAAVTSPRWEHGWPCRGQLRHTIFCLQCPGEHPVLPYTSCDCLGISRDKKPWGVLAVFHSSHICKVVCCQYGLHSSSSHTTLWGLSYRPKPANRERLPQLRCQIR